MATDGETITISHDTRMKLAKLRKGGQSYDSLISTIADQVMETSEYSENWDVERIDGDRTKFGRQTLLHL
jgi:predicted CopG family antitoxin